MKKIRFAQPLSVITLMVFAVSCSKHEMQGIMDVTFQVEAPGLAENETVYITGNIPELGNWDLQFNPLIRKEGDLWERVISIPYGSRMEYKFTLGSWTREALDDQGNTPPNHTLAATRSQILRHKITQWKSEKLPSAGVTGQVKYHNHVAGEGLLPRTLIVWLPPGYDDNDKRRYPVLYMHDGQNVFDPATSFLGVDWGVDETITRLMTDRLIHPVIVVGIYNTPDRSDDYGTGDKGMAYQAFVVNVVKPLIDATYRTEPGRENTAVMGSSMGGLISFLLAWNYPEVFQHAACLSPAFFSNAVDMVRQASSMPDGLRIYMDNGTIGLEEKLQVMCDEMMGALAEKGYMAGNPNFEWFLDQGAEHNERAWAIRVERPLLFMFGAGEP